VIVPFDRSYWVVPGKLLAGCYPGDADEAVARERLGRVVDSGIRVFLNLMEEHETDHDGAPFAPYDELVRSLFASSGIAGTVRRVPVRDLDVPDRATMRFILDFIDFSVAGNNPVYVHCWGGRGRTGTVVGCYLARHGIGAGRDALDGIRYLRRHEATAHLSSPQTDIQRDLVRSWKLGD